MREIFAETLTAKGQNVRLLLLNIMSTKSNLELLDLHL